MKKTLTNLMVAFAGESQARNRYTFYASVARKEGYEKIGEIFTITAENEREHAKKIFELIQKLKKEIKENNEISFEMSAPTIIGTTVENLKSAIAGETFEETKMYPMYADTAQKEGYPEVAKLLKSIIIAERHHKERYQEILTQLENGTFFKKDEIVEWVCRECGYVHRGKEPPEKCPLCEHAKSFYELKTEKF